MTKPPFLIGDVVRLTGAAVRMTVDEVRNDVEGYDWVVFCVWHDDSGALQREPLDPAALVLLKDAEAARGSK